MTITIKETPIVLRYSLRGLLFYEGLKHDVSGFVSGATGDSVLMLWAFIAAECERTLGTIPFKLDDFINYCDEDPSNYLECVKWLEAEGARQQEMRDRIMGDGAKGQKKSP